MRFFSFVLIACFGFCLTVSAQNLDVNSVVADPMTFTFNDGKHTVHGYVYSMLEKATSCCGNDAIYLEVVFDQTGRVTSTKTLTGKNDCYKQSVKDVIRNVRWDATGVKSSKTIYFEVKPIIHCSGSGNENVYKTVPLILSTNSGAVATNTGTNDTDDDMSGDDDDVVMGDDHDMTAGDDDTGGDDDDLAMGGDDDMTAGDNDNDTGGDDDVAMGGDDDMTTGDDDNPGDTDDVAIVADDTNTGDSDGDDGFLSDSEGDDNTSTDSKDDGWANMYNHDEEDSNASTEDDDHYTAHTDDAVASNNSSSNNSTSKASLPGQAAYSYNSTGNKDPDESHAGSFKNMPGPVLSTPAWANDENGVAVLIKQSLRRNGVCGLAQSLIELTLDPQGNVVNHNILKSSSDQIAKLLPEVLKEVKFKAQPQARFNYVTYIQFKTDIMCQTDASRQPIDLDTVQDYIILDTK